MFQCHYLGGELLKLLLDYHSHLLWSLWSVEKTKYPVWLPAKALDFPDPLWSQQLDEEQAVRFEPRETPTDAAELQMPDCASYYNKVTWRDHHYLCSRGKGGGGLIRACGGSKSCTALIITQTRCCRCTSTTQAIWSKERSTGQHWQRSAEPCKR